MSTGILMLPLLPLRSEPSERAEMTTQLLFGELFEILEVKGSWSLIRNRLDGYEGWATNKMLTELTEEMVEFLRRYPSQITKVPITYFRKVGQLSPILVLPAGSTLYASDETGRTFFYPCKTLDGYDLIDFCPKTIKGFVPSEKSESLPLRILDTAMCFLNAPYLWGGKTIFGMDCSGLTQVSASIHGFCLPRDAKDQALLGREVALKDAQPGDLAFFSNLEGRIIHVGLVMDHQQILHASGSVRIDVLDAQGIFNRELHLQTHQLHSIKRIFVA